MSYYKLILKLKEIKRIWNKKIKDSNKVLEHSFSICYRTPWSEQAEILSEILLGLCGKGVTMTMLLEIVSKRIYLVSLSNHTVT